MEQMLGSYGPHPKGEAYVKNFDPEESPSGMLARSGTYHVRSRVVDDDGEVYAGEYECSVVGSLLLTFRRCRLGVVFQARKGMVKEKNRFRMYLSYLHLYLGPAYLCYVRNQCIGVHEWCWDCTLGCVFGKISRSHAKLA